MRPESLVGVASGEVVIDGPLAFFMPPGSIDGNYGFSDKKQTVFPVCSCA